MAEKNEKLDARFDGAPSKENGVKLSDSGIASLEELDNGLLKVTDRDGRVSIFPRDPEPANMSREQHQAAVDAAIENSPVDPELSPGHSSFDPDKSLAVAPDKVENEKVVNKDLGVDKQGK